MNEEQKKVLSFMRDELKENQIIRLIDIKDDLDLTAKELMSTLNVLDVVQNRNKPRIQLVSVFVNMSQVLQDIIKAKDCYGEDKSV